MEHVPDAPWIRDAEMNGYPSPDPVYCPLCDEECLTIYRDRYGTVFGCDRCIEEQDAGEWAEEERLASRPDWDDESEE